MKHFVGLDVSMKETAVCVVDDYGQRVWEGSVPSPADAIAAIMREKAPAWCGQVWRQVIKLSGFGMPCGRKRSQSIAFTHGVLLPH